MTRRVKIAVAVPLAVLAVLALLFGVGLFAGGAGSGFGSSADSSGSSMDTRQAALMLEAAQRAVDASAKGLEQAEEESRVVRGRFEAGRGIQLEVLDAQVTVTRARFNAVNALADYEIARAMYLVEGDGELRWREEPAVSAAIAVCVAGTLAMGVLPQPFVRFAQSCLLK